MTKRRTEENDYTLVVNDDDDYSRRSMPIETTLGPYDKAIIQDCVNKGIDCNECFSLVTKNRQSNGRPLITFPAVHEFYEKSEMGAAKENCVFTGLKTKNYVDFSIFSASGELLGTIKAPVCESMVGEIIGGGVKATVSVGLMGDLPPKCRVAEGEHLPVLSGSRWAPKSGF